MKKSNMTTSKGIAAILLAATAVCTVVGCSAKEEVTTPPAQAEEIAEINDSVAEAETAPAETTELVTYEFETFDNVKIVIDESSIVAQEPSEDPEYSDLVPEEARDNIIAPGRDYVYLEDDENYYVADLYRKLITVADKSKVVVDAADAEATSENSGLFETDTWSITYDTDKWYGYVGDEGNIIINYLGEAAGTSYIEITELDVTTAGEALAILEEKKGKELTVIDDIQTSEEYYCFAYAADEVYESGLYIADSYNIYEHNGKVIVLDEAITHDDDEGRAEALAEEFMEVKNTLILK